MSDTATPDGRHEAPERSFAARAAAPPNRDAWHETADHLAGVCDALSAEHDLPGHIAETNARNLEVARDRKVRRRWPPGPAPGHAPLLAPSHVLETVPGVRLGTVERRGPVTLRIAFEPFDFGPSEAGNSDLLRAVREAMRKAPARDFAVKGIAHDQLSAALILGPFGAGGAVIPCLAITNTTQVFAGESRAPFSAFGGAAIEEGMFLGDWPGPLDGLGRGRRCAPVHVGTALGHDGEQRVYAWAIPGPAGAARPRPAEPPAVGEGEALVLALDDVRVLDILCRPISMARHVPLVPCPGPAYRDLAQCCAAALEEMKAPREAFSPALRFVSRFPAGSLCAAVERSLLAPLPEGAGIADLLERDVAERVSSLRRAVARSEAQREAGVAALAAKYPPRRPA